MDRPRSRAGRCGACVSVNERVGRRVTVRGNVGSPGEVGFTAGMRLSDAIRLSGGIKPTHTWAKSSCRDSVAPIRRASTPHGVRTALGTDDLSLHEDDGFASSITEFRAPSTSRHRRGAPRGCYAYRRE
jgi:protein involved in polysaccharide export with SLBB domain